MSEHVLTNIGSFNGSAPYNLYTTSENPGQNTTPNAQSLNVYGQQGAQPIARAIIDTDIVVAEQQTNMNKYQSENRRYYKPQFDGVDWNIVEETGAGANNMPLYLKGWDYYDSNQQKQQFSSDSQLGVQYDDGTHYLTNEMLSDVFLGQTNLNLYASWGNTRLLRVIIFYMDELYSRQDNLTYEVTINENISYSSNFELSNTFKHIKDISNTSYHGLSVNGTSSYEYGSGHASIEHPNQPISAANPVQYFGVKDGKAPTIQIQCTGSNVKIPSFVYNKQTNTADYYGYVCADGLSRYFDTTYYNKDVRPQTKVTLMRTENQLVWTVADSKFNNLGSDKTLFVPLISKPLITLIAIPFDGSQGMVELDPIRGTRSPSASASKDYMPGESSTILATPAQNYSFKGWYWDQSGTDLYGTNAQATFNVESSLTLYALFQQAEYTITYFKNKEENLE